VSARRRVGLAALAVGLGLVLGVRLVPGLGGPPLYDGVVPVGPYLWLNPGAGQQGGAQGATATIPVDNGQNDLVALATAESLPQAQLLATPGALVLAPGATSMSVSIQPVPVPGLPTDGVLASNVYRFVVKDQNGSDATARASAKVSIVLRSADTALLSGIVERWDGSKWTPLKTAPPGVNGAYLAVITGFGDYAVVRPIGAGTSGAPGASSGAAASASVVAAASGSTPSPVPTQPAAGDTGSGGPSLLLPIAVAAVVAIAAFVVMVLLSRRTGPPPASQTRPARRRENRTPYRGAHRDDDADDADNDAGEDDAAAEGRADRS
jgi:hypothetical protein